MEIDCNCDYHRKHPYTKRSTLYVRPDDTTAEYHLAQAVLKARKENSLNSTWITLLLDVQAGAIAAGLDAVKFRRFISEGM